MSVHALNYWVLYVFCTHTSQKRACTAHNCTLGLANAWQHAAQNSCIISVSFGSYRIHYPYVVADPHYTIQNHESTFQFGKSASDCICKSIKPKHSLRGRFRALFLKEPMNNKEMSHSERLIHHKFCSLLMAGLLEEQEERTTYPLNTVGYAIQTRRNETGNRNN